MSKSPDIRFTWNEAVREVEPEEAYSHLSDFEVIDVRTTAEFSGELGHIKGAKLVTLGAPLEEYLKANPPTRNTLFVCRSGGRSGQATILSQTLGCKNCFNLKGGMLRWNERDLPRDET